MINKAVVPYRPEHAYDIINGNLRDEELQTSKREDIDKLIKDFEMAGPAYTLIMEDQIICCAGVRLIAPGRGEAWALLSKLFYRYYKTAFAGIRLRLLMIAKERQLRRIESLVRVGFKEGERFLEHLGFNRETKDAGMRFYGPQGEDYHMYARIF